MAYIKRNKDNKKNLLEEENNDLNTQENYEINKVEFIKSEDLLSYISMGDFSKVQLAIKSQIKIDQDNYNNDIIKSLNNLETAIKIYSNANNNLIKILSTVNDLLAYTKGKDYFIKGFDNVEFELNEYNTTEIKSKLIFLQDLIGKNETISLIKQINSVVNINNTNVINREDSPFLSQSTSSDLKKVQTNDSNFSIKDNFLETESDEGVVDKIEVEEDIPKKDIPSFDITKNFTKENKEPENTQEEPETGQDEQSDKESKVVKFDIKDNFSEREELVNDESDTGNNNFGEVNNNNIDNNDSFSFDITKNFTNENEEIDNLNSKDIPSEKEIKVVKIDNNENSSETERDESEVEQIMTGNNNFGEVDNYNIDNNNNETDNIPSSSNNVILKEIKTENIDEIENIGVNNTSEDKNSKKINILDMYDFADYNFEDEEDDSIDKNININENEERVEAFKMVV